MDAQLFSLPGRCLMLFYFLFKTGLNKIKKKKLISPPRNHIIWSIIFISLANF